MSLHQLDPIAIRQALEEQRQALTLWPQAWAMAVGAAKFDPTIEAHVFTFMERHFRAAYFNHPGPHGRCKVPARDVSAAVGALFSLDASDRDAEIVLAVREGQTCQQVADAHGISKQRVSQIVQTTTTSVARAHRDREYCRSGDGCDRLAVRGRHGRMWCEHHGAELARLSVGLRVELARADPRNGGNDSLYSHKAAAA